MESTSSSSIIRQLLKLAERPFTTDLQGKVEQIGFSLYSASASVDSQGSLDGPTDDWSIQPTMEYRRENKAQGNRLEALKLTYNTSDDSLFEESLQDDGGKASRELIDKISKEKGVKLPQDLVDMLLEDGWVAQKSEDDMVYIVDFFHGGYSDTDVDYPDGVTLSLRLFSA